jgi:hypothetical protein
MTEDYFHWHDGVELDVATQTWRGFIRSNDDHDKKVLTDDSFDDKGDAVVAAGKMLAEARHGNPPT